MEFNIDGQLFPNIWTFITQLAATGVLFLVFAKFLYKPVVNLLNKRSDKMQEDLALAKQERELAQVQHQKAQETYQEAVANSKQLINDSRLEAEQVKANMIQEAKHQANHQLEMAKQAIQGQHRDMKDSIKDEIVEVALAAATKFLKQESQESHKREAIAEILKELSDNE